MAVSPCPDSCPITRRFTKPRPPTSGHPFSTAVDNRRSFAPSVTAAALRNENTVGKTTHMPQLDRVEELDNPSAERRTT